ncbi:rRNA methyltransferase 2, mitochondrial [Hyalella azteca]|uniref:rRNA methyltransferase 2, mitochondrial n=1 Tax=Hyalella azteca TaxID=294128 RepID=A0A8B7PG95_HYAAZ|nr:rRNA methyltransferase 2, mitochondrial [Hyalella azteca]
MLLSSSEYTLLRCGAAIQSCASVQSLSSCLSTRTPPHRKLRDQTSSVQTVRVGVATACSIHTCSVQSLQAGRVLHKIVPSNLRGKSRTAQDWLTRQLNDPYVAKARRLNYRARSAFKLLELQERLSLLRAGATVLECGASPGAWTQVAVQHCNPEDSPTYKSSSPTGCVVAVDLQPVSPVPGATFVCGDFTSPDTQQRVLQLLPKGVDVVLSDMAPSATGIKEHDHTRIMRLAVCAAHFAVRHATPHSCFLCKVWAGGEVDKFLRQLSLLYEDARLVKPPSSRSNSAELFVYARGLKSSNNNAANQQDDNKDYNITKSQ